MLIYITLSMKYKFQTFRWSKVEEIDRVFDTEFMVLYGLEEATVNKNNNEMKKRQPPTRTVRTGG